VTHPFVGGQRFIPAEGDTLSLILLRKVNGWQ